jgi:hypothetical protein
MRQPEGEDSASMEKGRRDWVSRSKPIPAKTDAYL